ITTDRLDTPAFLSKSQLRDLHQRGHVLGSHSCSHPLRMSHCAPTQLFDEWSRSRRVLEDILGTAVQTASVPGGFYSPQVGQAAALAGLTQLFTSEPTTRSWTIDRCTVHGRFTVYRGMSAADAAALVSSPLRRARQAGLWTAKKLAKQLGGTAYLNVRERLFRRAYAPASP
ncbi:MAG: polysaccharide deacetylase family protein, partial [Planctomycetaceae bacterium]|nr:polysaccharide deacetylase family protein [Planctomycetaceae bacterium]